MIDFKNISFISVIAIVAIIVMSATEMNNGNNKVVITKQEELSRINENIGGQAFATKLNNDENKRDIINSNPPVVGSCECSGGGQGSCVIDEYDTNEDDNGNTIITWTCKPGVDSNCNDCPSSASTANQIS